MEVVREGLTSYLASPQLGMRVYVVFKTIELDSVTLKVTLSTAMLLMMKRKEDHRISTCST